MGGYQKRKRSESLENDTKRFAIDRNSKSYERKFGVYCVKEKYSEHASDVKRKPSYDYSSRYNSSYDQTRNTMSSTQLSNSDFVHVKSECEAYNRGRQSNFKYETYVDTLESYKSRDIDLNQLWIYLTNIDLSYDRKWNFSTAYDLTQELETSLKYYIDTRNEIIFLRKIARQIYYVPFSYNEINISNTGALFSRIDFLETESTYRSHRMNQLFQHLQSVVIPSIIDDIRCAHRMSFDATWINRARYWFHQFKKIRWENDSRSGSKYSYNGSKYSRRETQRRFPTNRTHRSIGNVVKKSETVTPSSTLAHDKLKKEYRETIAQQKCEAENCKSIQTGVITTETSVQVGDENNNKFGNPHERAAKQSKEDKKVHDYEENINEEASVLSNSVILVEPNISIITVTDEDDKIADPNVNIPGKGT